MLKQAQQGPEHSKASFVDELLNFLDEESSKKEKPLINFKKEIKIVKKDISKKLEVADMLIEEKKQEQPSSISTRKKEVVWL